MLKTKKRVESEIEQLMDNIETNLDRSMVKMVRLAVSFLRSLVNNLACGQVSVNGIIGTLSNIFGNKQDPTDKNKNAETPRLQEPGLVLAIMVGASVELAQGMHRSSGTQI